MERLRKGLVPEYIRSLTPYSPGKPIEELERELGIMDSIKLASNENPLGPSRKAVEAIGKALNDINRYPDGGGYYLKQRLSEFYEVDMGNIILGNGSNEIIELAVRTFLGHGEEAIIAYPTFLVYAMIVQATGGRVVKIPLKDFTYDLQSMGEVMTPATRLIFIANPNNPTGTTVRRGEFERFLDRVPEDAVIILDEAYHEYVTDTECPDGTEYLKNGKNLIILRTFSKIYGLAGLRIGYGIADEALIDNMNRVRQPFNVNSLAQVGALAALEDREHIRRSRDNNIKGLKFLFKEIEALGFVCVPTQANFFLIEVGDGEDIYRQLLNKGVIVRAMAAYSLKEYIRVTVGLPQENERFIKAFKEVMLNKLTVERS